VISVSQQTRPQTTGMQKVPTQIQMAMRQQQTCHNLTSCPVFLLSAQCRNAVSCESARSGAAGRPRHGVPLLTFFLPFVLPSHVTETQRGGPLPSLKGSRIVKTVPVFLRRAQTDRSQRQRFSTQPRRGRVGTARTQMDSAPHKVVTQHKSDAESIGVLAVVHSPRGADSGQCGLHGAFASGVIGCQHAPLLSIAMPRALGLEPASCATRRWLLGRPSQKSCFPP